ncbi:MAG: alpha/beta hydrolase, partial [Rhodospirillales bacterium]|nr:alpha/beta hydrolase [Rhodospirillales bacterium]
MSDSEIAALKAQIRNRPRVTDLAQRRADSDARGRAFGVPQGVTIAPVDAGGVKAEWATPLDADDRRAVLYLHGGGYVIGSCESHRHLSAEIARTAGMRVLTIDYRLAPEHPFPAPVEDTIAA